MVTTHDPCYCHPSATFAAECVVWRFASVGEGTVFGARCVIGSNVYVGKGVQAGNDVRIQHGAFIPNGTTIGNRVFIGPNVTLCDDKHPRVCNPLYHAKPPVLEHDCSIGAGAAIMPGVRIGEGATVGAGAVVTHDVPAFTTVYGVPAAAVATATSVEGVCHA